MISAYKTFFFALDEQPELVLFRIVFGITVFILMSKKLRWVREVYGPNGFGHASAIGGGFNLLTYLPKTDLSAYLVLCLGALGALGIAFGAFTNVSAAIVFVVTATINARTAYSTAAVDRIIGLLSFLLIFSSAGGALSLDAILGARPLGWPTDNLWALRLMQLQLCLIYLITSIRKTTHSPKVWFSGHVVYYMMKGPHGRVHWPLLQTRIVSVALTWLTLCLELGFPVLIWVPVLRYPMLLAMVTFHIGLQVTLRTGSLQWMMLCALILFVPSQDAAWLLSMLRNS